jgi:PAS domain-containing protein
MHASLAYKILSQLNSNTQFGETIDLILNMIRDVTKNETAGIRLRQGDDFPFFSQRGMDKDFLATENSLLAKDEDHHVCRDENGNILLECICGQVISGKFNPENSHYTKGGSFWTNDSSLFAELSKPFNHIVNPRNVCIKSGYLSMAMIPIRAEQATVGLLQLNDRQRDRFTPDMIRFYESIGNMIGVAFMRKQAQEDLRKSHDLLFKLSEQVPGVIYQYQLFADGSSCFPYASSGINMIYEVSPEEVRLDASPAFGRLHPDDLQRVSDLIMESARDLSYFYCEFRVALPKQGVKWRYCTAVPEKLSDNSVLWHGIIWDITKLKETENSLTTKMEELQRFHNLTVDRELFMIELKKEINELLKKSGLPPKYKIVEL